MVHQPPKASVISPEYAILGLLLEKPAHGYELSRRLVEALGRVWRLNLNQIYNTLKRLEEQGYISGENEPQEKLPDRRRYFLTEKGRQHFELWLESPTACSVRAIRLEFTARLYFASRFCPQRLGQLIDDQIRNIQAGLAQLEADSTKIPAHQIINRLGWDLRIRQLNSVITWLEDCRSVLVSE